MLALLAGCNPSGAAPRSTEPDAAPADSIARFVTDWQAGRTQDASRLTSDPAAAALLMSTVAADLKATDLAIRTGAVTRGAAGEAEVQATLTWTLPVAGTWTYQVPWRWTRQPSATGPEWRLQYSPAIVNPDLGPQQTLAVRETPTTAGTIVDRNDVQLLTPVRVYSVVVLVGKIADARTAADAIAALISPLEATVTADSIRKGIADARAGGQDSYTVVNLRESDFDTVQTELAAIPGVGVHSRMRDLPPTKDFAKVLLDQATPVAQRLTQGRPGWRIVAVDTAGDELATLKEQPPVPGPKVTLTIDPAVQRAAQGAIAQIPEPAVLIAIQPSSGEILAVAQNPPADAEGPIALTGRYPPGSIFKIVTATAAIDRQLIRPDTKVSCPGAWTLDHRTIHNEGFALGTVTATQAFAHSCNTTFARLASELPDDALPAAAAQYGIGLDFDVAGIITLTGAVRVADSVLARAENGFGQGTDLLTPFSAALMAATAATGNMPMPVLIRGTTTTVDRPAPPRSKAAQADIRVLMRSVVTEGTARQLAGAKFGEVSAKTGTAEYVGADGEIHAHAWTVGFRGDLAFAALIVGGDDSKRTNAVVGAFLAAVPAS